MEKNQSFIQIDTMSLKAKQTEIGSYVTSMITKVNELYPGYEFKINIDREDLLYNIHFVIYKIV